MQLDPDNKRDERIISRQAARTSGLKWYFIGVPCKRGHIEFRLVSNSACRRCAGDAHRQFISAYQRTERGKAVKAAAQRKYKQSQAGKTSDKKYRDGHKENARQKDARYRQTENGRRSASLRQATYRQTEAGRRNHQLIEATRRARKRDSSGLFAKDDFARLVETQTKCHVCLRKFSVDDPATIDHVVPLAAGGAHDRSNIALAHKSCNSRKQKIRTHLI